MEDVVVDANETEGVAAAATPENKPPAPLTPVLTPSVPVFEEQAAAVAESKILVGGEENSPVLFSDEVIPEVAGEEKSVGKVDESRIIVNNEEQPKEQVDDSDLGDFLKNL